MNADSKSLRLPPYLKVVVILTLVNLVMLTVRNLYAGDSVFNFLKSNLFSGLIPLIIAFMLQKFYSQTNSLVFWLVSLLWVLFYPNSPYMISDLIHDDADTRPVTDLIVFDTLVIFSIAMLSVFYGFISLKIMFSLFKEKYNKKYANIFIAVSLVLSCLGFYMGREMLSAIKLGNGYLYSWEIFLEPVQIFKAVWNLLFPIGTHVAAYLMMIMFGVIQCILLVMMKDVGDIESGPIISKE